MIQIPLPHEMDLFSDFYGVGASLVVMAGRNASATVHKSWYRAIPIEKPGTLGFVTLV